MLGLERTTLTRSLDGIEKEGLIRVESVDGRTRNVILTQRGKDRLDLALPLSNQAQQKLRRKLGEQGWAIVNDDLVLLAESSLRRRTHSARAVAGERGQIWIFREFALVCGAY